MKTLLIICLILPQLTQAQRRGTNVEEYNYITKGLREDMMEAKDVKSGYRFESISEAIKIGEYTFNFTSFIKIDEKQMVAVKVSVSSSKGNYDICVPFKNQELTTAYYQSIQSWDAPMARAYSYATSLVLAKLTNSIVDMEFYNSGNTVRH